MILPLATAPALVSCMWVWPLKLDVDPPRQPLVSHCTPYGGEHSPVLLDASLGPRAFDCRLNAEDVTWTLEFTGIDVEGYELASGVERVVLERGDLPSSPRPYEAELILEAATGGLTLSWRLVVTPEVDSLFDPETVP